MKYKTQTNRKQNLRANQYHIKKNKKQIRIGNHFLSQYLNIFVCQGIYNQMNNTIRILILVILSKGVLNACQGSCSNCTGTTCSSCMTTYYLYLGVCNPCMVLNCDICQAPGNRCTKCINDYFLTIDNLFCHPCNASNDLNCASVNNIFNNLCFVNNSYCVNCQSFAVNGKGLCLPCSQVYRNCLKCNNTVCLTCNTGYLLNVTANNLQCVSCSIPRCLQCAAGPICVNCSSGYYAINGTCQPCKLPCATCSSATSCDSCSPGTPTPIFFNNSCLYCNNSIYGKQGCATCSFVNFNFTCLTCLPGYKRDFGALCQACVAPCLTCDTSNCLSCVNDSYFYNTSNFSCDLCSIPIPNCINCLDSTKCIKCSDGYIITTNTSYCNPCSSLFQGCATCDSAECFSCMAGLFFQQDLTCGPSCQSPCVLCTISATQCKTCIVGYYLISNNYTCLICHPNCTTCVNYTYCVTCIKDYVNVNGTCQACPIRQQFNPFTLVCQYCPPHCVSCYWWTGCDSCLPLFELTHGNGVNICTDICGDTYAIDSPCDLFKGIPNDGCTDQCTIQPNYNCSKSLNTFNINGVSTSLNTSQCSYIGSISISIYAASQSITSNILSLTFSIVPYLYGFPTNSDTQTYIQSIFQLSPLGSSDTYNVVIDSVSQRVTFNIDHKSDISNLPMNLLINTAALSSNPMFQYASPTSYSFQPSQILSYGRLGQLEPEDSLSLCKIMHNWSNFLAIVSVVIMAMGIFGKELVALEQAILCQSVYLLLSFYEGKLTLPMASLNGLKYSSGLHFAAEPIRLSQNQNYIMGVDTSSFIKNFNFNILSYLLPLVFSLIILIYKLRNKHLPARRDLAQQTYQVLMGQSILYLAVFNLIPLISYAYIYYTQSQQNNYYDTVAIFIASLFPLFGIFNFFVKPEIVGIFRSCFKTQNDQIEAGRTGYMEKYVKCISKRCFEKELLTFYNKIALNFSLIYFIYLFIFTFMVVFKTNTMVIAGIQIFILIIIVMVRPHFNIFQKLRAILTWIVTLLGTLIVIMKPNTFMLIAVFLGLLSVHMVGSIFILSASLIHQMKRKCNDRSQIVRKLMKQGQIQNQKSALRQLILRYQNLSKKRMTIDHQVEKIQLQFNLKHTNKDEGRKKRQIMKIQDNKEAQDQQMIRFQDEIIVEEQDHFRFQKGMQFFNKYDGKIDIDLVKQKYEEIQQ